MQRTLGAHGSAQALLESHSGTEKINRKPTNAGPTLMVSREDLPLVNPFSSFLNNKRTDLGVLIVGSFFFFFSFSSNGGMKTWWKLFKRSLGKQATHEQTICVIASRLLFGFDVCVDFLIALYVCPWFVRIKKEKKVNGDHEIFVPLWLNTYIAGRVQLSVAPLLPGDMPICFRG